MFTRNIIEKIVVLVIALSSSIYADSNWDNMKWDQDSWDESITNCISQAQLDQAVADAEVAKDKIIADKDQIIADREETIVALTSSSNWDEMEWDQDNWDSNSNNIALFTQAQLDAAVALANPDNDGDGVTDAEEIANGTDPNKYVLSLKEGWNLVSIARKPNANSVSAILRNNNLSPVWTWDGTRFELISELLPLRGYWVYAIDDVEIPIELP